eukprot:14118684-Ditylum_brightwellii.AAC.1
MTVTKMPPKNAKVAYRVDSSALKPLSWKASTACRHTLVLVKPRLGVRPARHHRTFTTKISANDT